MADKEGQYWDSKIGAVPAKYKDMGDDTWSVRHAADAPPYTHAFAHDANGNLEYHGRAALGASKAAGVWQIKKFIYAADLLVDEQWADGNPNFDNVWNNRASLSYS